MLQDAHFCTWDRLRRVLRETPVSQCYMPWRPLVACVVQCPRHSHGWRVVMRACLQDSQILTWKLGDWYISMILRFRAFYFASGIYTKYKQFLSKDKLIFRRLSKVCILVLCAILPLDVTVNFNPYNCAFAEKLRNIWSGFWMSTERILHIVLKIICVYWNVVWMSRQKFYFFCCVCYL